MIASTIAQIAPSSNNARFGQGSGLRLSPNEGPGHRSQFTTDALHDRWFKAFDTNDSDTMNAIETVNITLVVPNGYILKNFSPRKKADVAGSGKDSYSHPEIKRKLSNVSVRQFGDSALLAGIVTTESPKEKSQSAETVSFVRISGQWKIASAQWTDLAKPQ